MNQTIARLPAYLKKYCVEQDYDAYTARDHAAWRFIMRQSRNFFRTHAVDVYEAGLAKTGIPIDRIPRISEMDEKLGQFGWGAVAVSGFIPPSAFLEFQALGVLAIACDMRSAEHIEYTPAPDIVHEAAGHAPILADPAYASYLKRYAQMAKKAIFSREDINVYEAVRYLSDIKENPDTSTEEIQAAEARFFAATKAISHVSEATKVGRMAWWTVEYGLVGAMHDPKIYGAGLLSSVGESQNCLSADVQKLPLSVDCVEQAFDITKPQPQLFVAKNMAQLTDVLEDLERTMAFVLGGKVGLERAHQSQMINTIVLDSGLEIAGQLENYELGASELPQFLKLKGPVQLGYAGSELLGHGRSRHSQGYSSPLGRMASLPEVPAHDLTDEQLKKLGCSRGREWTLNFTSGFRVKGIVGGWTRRNGRLILMNFRRATVSRGSAIYFEPSWGEFDLGFGEKIISVHGGPANREDFGEYDVGMASTKPGRTSAYSEDEICLFKTYQTIRDLRLEVEKSGPNATQVLQLESISEDLLQRYPDEWLAHLEVLEVAKKSLKMKSAPPAWYRSLEMALGKAAQEMKRSQRARLIQLGLALSGH